MLSFNIILLYNVIGTTNRSLILRVTLEFEWDEFKNKQNQLKHGISFEEVKTIFNDPYSITINDPNHSIDEARFIDIGLSINYRILVVVYTERQNKIRIIICRKATLLERRIYEQ